MTLPIVKTALILGPAGSGKTTLFDALTRMNQSITYYPNATIEKKEGICRDTHGNAWNLIDLPGIISLTPNSELETIACKLLLNKDSQTPHIDLILCVINAAAIERQLALVLQLLGLGIPLILVLNKTDLAESEGAHIDLEALISELGNIPIIPAQAYAHQGLIELKQCMALSNINVPGRMWTGDAFIENALKRLTLSLEKNGEPQPCTEALLFLAGLKDNTWDKPLPPYIKNELDSILSELETHYQVPASEVVSRLRFARATEIIKKTVRRTWDTKRQRRTDILDSLLLHPIWGWVCFFATLIFIFWSLFTWMSAPSEWIASGLNALADGVGYFLQEGDLKDLITQGIIPGISAIMSFLPQILFLFLSLGVMEGSGYMARSAFLMDRTMRRLGLSGKAFIPLISAHACSIPAILSTRVINNPKERLLTIIAIPWISCSARLPVFIVLIATLFGGRDAAWQQTLLLFLLYMIGTGSAFLLIRLMRKPITQEAPAPLLIELPCYRLPSLRYLLHLIIDKCWDFLKQAGTIIFCFSIILWFLSTYPRPEEETNHEPEKPYITQIGQFIEPVFAPLGFDWRISTGLIASLGAREMFNSHMSILFSTEEARLHENALHKGAPNTPEPPLDVENDSAVNLNRLSAQFRHATKADGTPLFTPSTCIGLLLFFIYALQCVPTITMIKRETQSWKGTALQVIAMCCIAYIMAYIPQFIAQFFS